MTCPICDQKPMNCDCTPEEKRQYAEIGDLQDEIELLRGYRDAAESDAAVARLLVERLRLTDEEREAIGVAIQCVEAAMAQRHPEEEDARDLLHKTSTTLSRLFDQCAIGHQ